MRNYFESILNSITSEKEKFEKQLSNPKSKLPKESVEKALGHIKRIELAVSEVPETIVRKKPGPKPKNKQQLTQVESIKKTKVAKPAKSTKPEATKPKITKNKDITNQTKQEIKSWPLTANFTNKRPLAVIIDGKEQMATSFRQVVEVVCRSLYKSSPKQFAHLTTNSFVNGDNHKYFSTTASEITGEPMLVGKGGTAVYIDIAKLAVNNMFFLKRVCTTMHKQPDEIQIRIDPSFERKHRDVTSKKSKK